MHMKKCLLLEINTITKLFVFKMKYVIDVGFLFDNFRAFKMKYVTDGGFLFDHFRIFKMKYVIDGGFLFDN